MEDRLKYRLVGAAVILALMAFFLPLILDSEKYRTEIVPQIPAMPEATTDPEQLRQKLQLQTSEQKNSDRASQEQGTLVIDLDKAVSEIPETNTKKSTETSSKTEPVLSESNNNPAANGKTQSKENAKDTNQAETKNEQVKAIETDTKKETAEVAKAVDTAKKVVTEKAKTPLPKTKVPEFKESAYIIQIGSFSNKDNALKLVNDLRRQDYRAYQRVSKDYSRVFVGPYPDKKIAESRSEKLTQLVGSKVTVLEFDPIKH